jgi:hypothetical protein
MKNRYSPRHFENDNKHLTEEEIKRIYSDFDSWVDKFVKDVEALKEKDLTRLKIRKDKP